MASGKEFPLSLIIRAVDKATGPLRKIGDRLRKNFSDPAKKIGEALGNVGTEVLSLGAKIGAFGVGAGIALFGIVKSAMDAGDKLGEMAQRVGLGVDAYAQLQFAAAQADVDAGQFNASMDKFNKALGEMKAGGGPIVEFLKKVSPALLSQVRGAKSTEEALGLMTRAFEKVKDPAKRAALASAVFGKSGLQMGQFLGQGTEEIERQRKKFLELSGSQEAFAKGAGDLDNAMRETETAFLGVRNALAAELFPAFKEIAGIVRDFLVEHREEIREWAKAFGKWLPGAVKTAVKFVTTLWQKFGGLKTALVATIAVLVGPLLGALGGLATAFLGLGASIMATPIGWVAGAFALLAGAAAAVGAALAGILFLNREELAPAFEAVAASAGALWEQLKSLFGGMSPGGTSAVKALAVAIGQTFLIGVQSTIESVRMLITMLDLMVDAFQNSWAIIQPIANQMGGGVLGAIGSKMLGAETQRGPSARERANAADIKAQLENATLRTGRASVRVDFSNLPKGARVTQDGKGAPLDLNLGYSMETP